MPLWLRLTSQAFRFTTLDVVLEHGFLVENGGKKFVASGIIKSATQSLSVSSSSTERDECLSSRVSSQKFSFLLEL